MTKKPTTCNLPDGVGNERRTSPHKFCLAHSGIEKQLYIIIALGLMGMGIQAYAVMINQETREEMAAFGGKVASIEQRVSALEKKIDERTRTVYMGEP